MAARDSYAVRVLVTDLRLHGRRFVLAEFIGAALLAAVLALAVGIAALVRGGGQVAAVIAVVFFAGVAVNSATVASWVRRYAGDRPHARASLRDLGAFALATLVPGALAVSLQRSGAPDEGLPLTP